MRVLPGAALAVLVGTFSSAASGGEADAARCVSAAERGQRQRDEGRLVESRATLASCGEEACPVVVRRECLRWLAEVDERLPSVVLAVKDRAGKDVVDAALSVDGKPLSAANRGREFPLDPGQHRIVAKRAGAPESQETIIVREREKGRTLSLVLDTQAATPSERTPSERTPGSRPVPVFTWILAGTAVLGGASVAYFYSTGAARVHELRDSCAPRCTASEVADAERSLGIAHLSLGIGIAAAVGALVVYLVRPEEAARQSAARATYGLQF
jgi:hypothetical protein